MRVTELKYTKRFNLGNYEHAEIGATAALDEDDNMGESLQILKVKIEAAHNGDISPVEVEVKDDATPSKKKKATKKAAPAPVEDDEEEELDNEEAESEDETEEADEESEEETTDEDAEDVSDDEDEKPAKKSKMSGKKTSPGKKSFRQKGSNYSRNSDLHKKLFLDMIKENLSPKWLKDNAGRAKTMSIKMEGKEFLDGEGEILPSFVKEAMKIAKAK